MENFNFYKLFNEYKNELKRINRIDFRDFKYLPPHRRKFIFSNLLLVFALIFYLLSLVLKQFSNFLIISFIVFILLYVILQMIFEYIVDKKPENKKENEKYFSKLPKFDIQSFLNKQGMGNYVNNKKSLEYLLEEIKSNQDIYIRDKQKKGENNFLEYISTLLNIISFLGYQVKNQFSLDLDALFAFIFLSIVLYVGKKVYDGFVKDAYDKENSYYDRFASDIRQLILLASKKKKR